MWHHLNLIYLHPFNFLSHCRYFALRSWLSCRSVSLLKDDLRLSKSNLISWKPGFVLGTYWSLALWKGLTRHFIPSQMTQWRYNLKAVSHYSLMTLMYLHVAFWFCHWVACQQTNGMYSDMATLFYRSFSANSIFRQHTDCMSCDLSLFIFHRMTHDEWIQWKLISQAGIWDAYRGIKQGFVKSDTPQGTRYNRRLSQIIFHGINKSIILKLLEGRWR